MESIFSWSLLGFLLFFFFYFLFSLWFLFYGNLTAHWFQSPLRLLVSVLSVLLRDLFSCSLCYKDHYNILTSKHRISMVVWRAGIVSSSFSRNDQNNCWLDGAGDSTTTSRRLDLLTFTDPFQPTFLWFHFIIPCMRSPVSNWNN